MHGPAQHGGGNVKMGALHAEAKVCLHTRKNRWAMLVVTRPPPTGRPSCSST
ncbi:MAG: hypothetical protein ACJ786_16615 [Catenulispora sp.]